MQPLPGNQAAPVLRLSLSDLIMLLKACSGGSYVLGPMEMGPAGEPSFGVSLRIVGPVRPGKATSQAHNANPLACLLAAAARLHAAVQAGETQLPESFWDMSLRAILTSALLARCSREAANR